jgi:crossover junction endodeoxyribonuclease RuvC
MVVLGIDPGCIVSGFAVMKIEAGRTGLLDCGYLKMNPQHPLPQRVAQFYDHFELLLNSWPVDVLALETPFLGKNAQNFLKLGYLRGILYLLSHKHSLEIVELSPREVKQAVTGFGGADKQQVARVVLQLFPTLKAPDKFDATDAIAVTLCAAWRHKNDRVFNQRY